MIISVTALKILIVTATLMVAVAPLILLILWVLDKKGGKIW
ncbi:MAG: hypothetical protein P8171_01055 [Candidatus Thiodiazotropha sp.]|jgi:hypothetical protein